MAKTLFEKVWDAHIVDIWSNANAPKKEENKNLIFIDLHLVHEVTSPQAFDGLRMSKRKVRRPDLTFATMDHNVPTKDRDKPVKDPISAKQMEYLKRNCDEFGVPCFDLTSYNQGVVHVIGPELGLTLPGKTVVCGDSHTSTHGAFGALAFGIGTSEVEHVLATQCLVQSKAKTMRVNFRGKLNPGVYAKDMVLALIGKIGTAGATGFVLEYAGEAIENLSMEGRMTICNMSIEAGARAGMIAPDDKTFAYLKDREHAPKGADWDKAVAYWRTLKTDAGAKFDVELEIDCNKLAPQVTWGTSPGMVTDVTAAVPRLADAKDEVERVGIKKALEYMDFAEGTSIENIRLDKVFIGSCTNSRIEDLRDAASIFKGRKVQGVRTLVVPGSHDIKHQAEAEGLDKIFVEAGAEWREPGCSMCIAMNGDNLEPGQYAVSTSNRNFEGRQGKGGRTILASPLTAAAAAVTGKVTDVRELIG